MDPMLATGGSASDAITFIKEYGCKSITLMDIIAAPEGIDRVRRDRQDVDIFWRRWMKSSTSMPILYRDWATPATVFSALNKTAKPPAQFAGGF